MNAPEFSRIVKVRPHPPARLAIEAGEAERAALAARFGVVAVEALTAELAFAEDGAAIDAVGNIAASLVQACAVSGEDFAVAIDEPLRLRFVPQLRSASPDEELELANEEADEIEFDGEAFDLGEAVAQSLALAIDPYATGPGADAARTEAGITDENAPRGPLADALAALREG
jgi:hypothetical protein